VAHFHNVQTNSKLRTGHALFALGNVQTSIGEELLRNGKQDEGLQRLEQAYQTHQKTLRQFRATLGHGHHKVADAAHKVASHYHRKRDYGNAM
jgi:hypothetical protein